MEFNEIKTLVFEEYVKNGYLDLWTSTPFGTQRIHDLAEAGLIHTEVAELQEAIRSGEEKEKIASECADIIIRVMNWCTRNKIDLEEAILKKNIVNLEREKLHGRLI